MLELRYATPPQWVAIVLQQLDAFLQDHAANERKVSAAAMQLVVHHPEREQLVEALIEIAQEELSHFKRVYELLRSRGQSLGQDMPDPYMGKLRRAIRRPDVDGYLLDRLVMFGIVEARGCERFGLLADALEKGPLEAFYRELARSEARHHGQYLRLARSYFDRDEVERRHDALLELEAEVVRSLPLRAALH